MDQDKPASASAAQEADPVVRDGGPREAAEYVARAVGELSQLARAHRLEMLAYLLDMAKLEADETLKRSKIS